jgi:hypothetical protein
MLIIIIGSGFHQDPGRPLQGQGVPIKCRRIARQAPPFSEGDIQA